LEAKPKCGHGKWLKWLKENVRVTQQQAWRYMELARNWDPSKSVAATDLEGALRQLTAEPPPPNTANSDTLGRWARAVSDESLRIKTPDLTDDAAPGLERCAPVRT
jgi:hypothetical protein